MEANSFLYEVTLLYMGGGSDNVRVAYHVKETIHIKFPCVLIISSISILFIYLLIHSMFRFFLLAFFIFIYHNNNNNNNYYYYIIVYIETLS